MTWGGANNPRTSLTLKQGQTALIETLEKVTLPADVIAIAFPPAGVTIKGLLMINPGLVDPGYDGPLRCTVINMGREPYFLDRKSRILRLVLFRLARPPATTKAISAAAIDDELLTRLCQDFMSVEEKAIAIAKREVAAAQVRGPALLAVLAIVASIVTTILTNYFAFWKSRDEIIADLSQRVVNLQEEKLKGWQDYFEHRSGQQPPQLPSPPTLSPAPGKH
jgi:dUTPase